MVFTDFTQEVQVRAGDASSESPPSLPPQTSSDVSRQKTPTPDIKFEHWASNLSSKFTCFPRLPQEIRALIWKAVCFEPRNVDFNVRNTGELIGRGYTTADPSQRIRLHYFYSLDQVPRVLHVSKESRTEALRWYKLEFGNTVVDGGFTVICTPRIYINWEVDRLCWMTWGKFKRDKSLTGVEEELHRLLRGKLRFLALANDSDVHVLLGLNHPEPIIKAFSYVEEIAMIVESCHRGLPWKSKTIELEDLADLLSSLPLFWLDPQGHSLTVDGIRQLWDTVRESCNLGDTPRVRYMRMPSMEETQPE